MSNSLVTINLVVLNGEKYISHCLNAILSQTYSSNLIELNILDNGSTDETRSIIENCKFKIVNSNFSHFNFIKSEKNFGMWPGQEELLKYSNGEYIVTMAVDVIMDKNFILNSVETMGRDEKIGALQPKIYKYDIASLSDHHLISLPTKIIDTCGFKIFRSRRVINIGHGEPDFATSYAKAMEVKKATTGKDDNKFDFNKEQEIFAVEGAIPVFRKKALMSCKIAGEIVDHDYFWYGDDLDLAWRMRLLGWKEIFAPTVIAWHDRQTTKSLKKSWLDYIFRVPMRRQIPIKKRRLDWRNMRFTYIKNDYIINIQKDLPWILTREISVLGYAVLFEPGVLKEVPNLIKFLPKMLRKRKEIMSKALISPKEIRKWMI